MMPRRTFLSWCAGVLSFVGMAKVKAGGHTMRPADMFEMALYRYNTNGRLKRAIDTAAVQLTARLASAHDIDYLRLQWLFRDILIYSNSFSIPEETACDFRRVSPHDIKLTVDPYADEVHYHVLRDGKLFKFDRCYHFRLREAICGIKNVGFDTPKEWWPDVTADQLITMVDANVYPKVAAWYKSLSKFNIYAPRACGVAIHEPLVLVTQQVRKSGDDRPYPLQTQAHGPMEEIRIRYGREGLPNVCRIKQWAFPEKILDSVFLRRWKDVTITTPGQMIDWTLTGVKNVKICRVANLNDPAHANVGTIFFDVEFEFEQLLTSGCDQSPA